MNKKNVVIIGANGQLGTDLSISLAKNFSVLQLTHKDIEITERKSIQKTLSQIPIDILINTAAYTRVDEAETNPETAFRVNTLGVKNLADFVKNRKTTFVLYSTDYVFGQNIQKKTPYKETDLSGPVNTYGISKLAGEEYVRSFLKNYFIIRTTGLFGTAGSSGKGYNFIELMLSLSKTRRVIQVVDDQISSPTYTLDLADQTNKLLQTNKFGLYHITSSGSCSWYEFAKEIFRLTGSKVRLRSVDKKTWKTPAKRPSYSVLSNNKLKKIGIYEMKSWKQELREYLSQKNYI